MTIPLDMYVFYHFDENGMSPVNQLLATVNLRAGNIGYDSSYVQDIGGIGIDPINPDPPNEIFATIEDAIAHYITLWGPSILSNINASANEEFVYSNRVIYTPPPVQAALDLKADITALDDYAIASELSTVAYNGAYSSLAGKPSIPTTFDDLTAGTTNKVYTDTEKTKLSGIAANSTVNASDSYLLDRTHHTGTQSADTITDGSTNKTYTATEKTKLAGVATAATANDTDANLKARANHTGTQTADTITDGTTNKAYTATEKTKLAGIDSAATFNTKAYNGTTAKTGYFPVVKSAAVSSGTAVFHLTSDGTSSGTALYSTVDQDSVNVLVNDATASYQYGWVFSNSNKTLTVTVNKFTTANILSGILGQAAANGSVVKLTVWGN